MSSEDQQSNSGHPPEAVSHWSILLLPFCGTLAAPALLLLSTFKQLPVKLQQHVLQQNQEVQNQQHPVRDADNTSTLTLPRDQCTESLPSVTSRACNVDKEQYLRCLSLKAYYFRTCEENRGEQAAMAE